MVLKVSVCVTETHKRGNKRREEEELIHKTEEIMLNIPTVFTKILHTCKLLYLSQVTFPFLCTSAVKCSLDRNRCIQVSYDEPKN